MTEESAPAGNLRKVGLRHSNRCLQTSHLMTHCAPLDANSLFRFTSNWRVRHAATLDRTIVRTLRH